MLQSRVSIYSVCIAALVLTSPLARAESTCPTCSVEIRIGGSAASFNSEIRLDSRLNEEAVGDVLDFEDDLNYSKDDSFLYSSFNWRFLDRHSINIIYTEYSRSASISSENDIRFSDDVLLSGALISTEVKSSVKDIEYIYEFYSEGATRLGASAGVYWSTREFNLRAEGIVDPDGDEAATLQLDYRKSAEVDVPLPTFGLHLDYQISPRWSIKSNIRILKIQIGHTEGSFRNFGAELDYEFTKNLLGGIAFTSRSVNISSSREQLTGELNWNYDGIDLFFISRF